MEPNVFVKKFSQHDSTLSDEVHIISRFRQQYKHYSKLYEAC